MFKQHIEGSGFKVEYQHLKQVQKNNGSKNRSWISRKAIFTVQLFAIEYQSVKLIFFVYSEGHLLDFTSFNLRMCYVTTESLYTFSHICIIKLINLDIFLNTIKQFGQNITCSQKILFLICLNVYTHNICLGLISLKLLALIFVYFWPPQNCWLIISGDKASHKWEINLVRSLKINISYHTVCPCIQTQAT